MGNIAKVDQFKEVLNDNAIRAQIKNSTKENAGPFMTSMLDLYTSDNYLQKCDPRAVAQECLKAATLGLPIVKSLGFAYIVPYNNVPTFTVGYKGLIQLAQKSSLYTNINADVVYEGEIKNKDKLTGGIDLSGEKTSDTVIGYFAHFELQNGFKKTLYMTKEEMIEWADKYAPSYDKSKKSGGTPWYKEFDKMAIKTVLRRLIGTYGPMSVQMQKAFEIESTPAKVDREINQNANKKPLEFDEAEVVEEAETEYQPTPEEQAEIARQEYAEAGEPLPDLDI